MAITIQAVSRLVWAALLAPGGLLHPLKERSLSAQHPGKSRLQQHWGRGAAYRCHAAPLEVCCFRDLLSEKKNNCAPTRSWVSALRRSPLAQLLPLMYTKEAAMQCNCGRNLWEHIKHTNQWTQGLHCCSCRATMKPGPWFNVGPPK